MVKMTERAAVKIKDLAGKKGLAPVLRRLGHADDAKAAFDDAKRILDAAAKDERKHERQI